MNPLVSPFRLFVSYAHKGERNKERLLNALAPYRHNGLIETWNDRAINAGDDWEAEIDEAMNQAHGAIFVLDEYFLASRFCMKKEVEHLLQRHRDDKVLILFVLADHCGWEAIDFIRKFQVILRDGKCIKEVRPLSKAYTAAGKEIANALLAHREKHGLPQRATLATTAASSQPAIGSLDELLAKLPGATTHLFGRDTELTQIDAWKGHKGVFLWVADGGTGKSALVRKWLETQDWPAGTRFLGHSFYSQGSHNQATSARGFLLAALKQLNIFHEANAADDELGRLFAEEAAKAATVLVLDGIEPLQQLAKDDPKLNGMVKDRGLAALLEGLAKRPGQALCLASSRLPIPEASIADASYFREKHLVLLPTNGARELLRQRGVRGEDAELDKMAERCGFHPLALVLAAEFCHTYLQDRAAEFLSRPWQPKTDASHAATVMAWFDSALTDEHQALDRELARILGLFDRPAPWGALLALKAAESIPGLTETLHDADESAILESLARLSQWGLLSADQTRREPDLDAHPLVREYFGALLEDEDHQAWQAAHAVLFDWFRGLPDKEQPDTLEELEPLYRAVSHGCKAGRYRTAREKVYRDRIQRDEQGYSMFQLGAYSADLAALAGFFPDGWSHPPVAVDAGLLDETLSETNRSWLLAGAAFCLMALGRLEEALGPCRQALQAHRESADWYNFCISSEGLTELLTALGRWAEAETVSCEALDAVVLIADTEPRWQRTVGVLPRLGLVHHGQGLLAQALEDCRQAEALQEQNDQRLPKLWGGLRAYAYFQLLLEQADAPAGWREVLKRGEYSLEIVKGMNHQLSIALDHCTIGQSRAALGDPAAATALDLAVATMQRAGKIELQPSIHLARAQYRSSQHDFPAAWEDHAAAHAIAQRGNMRTYLAECALLAGNLHLDETRIPEAAAQYATAAQLIREDGYGRRLTELHLLHARLLHAQHDPAATSALAEAEARIREVGQWYFWRELRAVAKEIGAPDPGECPDQKASA